LLFCVFSENSLICSQTKGLKTLFAGNDWGIERFIGSEFLSLFGRIS
jgi:hypothetical protein